MLAVNGIHATENDLVSSTYPLSPQILVIDDEADIRFALSRILRLEGYAAVTAQSGLEALDCLEKISCDLVVLDLRMPEMDGLEVMRRIQDRYPDLPVIILTGQATIENAIAATKSDNVVDYLLKPINNDVFVKAVTTALQKRTERLRHQQLIQAATQMLSVMQPPDGGLNTISKTEESPARPAPSSTEDERFIQVYPLSLDRHKRLVMRANDPDGRIELTKGETSILACFLKYPNRILSCSELVTQGLGYETVEEEAESVIRPYIFRLRRKIETNPQKPHLIRTVRRKGYRFVSLKI